MKRETVLVIIFSLSMLTILLIISSTLVYINTFETSNQKVSTRASNVSIEHTKNNSFAFFFTEEVWNSQWISVKIEHHTGCKFSIIIHTQLENSSLIGSPEIICNAAFTLQSYSPGITKENRILEYYFENYSSDLLPNGLYIINLVGLRLKHAYSTIINATDGEYLISNDKVPDNWGTTPYAWFKENLLLIIPVVLVILLYLTRFIRLRNRLR